MGRLLRMPWREEVSHGFPSLSHPSVMKKHKLYPYCGREHVDSFEKIYHDFILQGRVEGVF